MEISLTIYDNLLNSQKKKQSQSSNKLNRNTSNKTRSDIANGHILYVKL
jgi:hypothetical protein